MLEHSPETVYKFIESLNGIVQHNSYGRHTNQKLAYMPISFEKWWFTSWFDFGSQTAHSPVYWFNKNPIAGYQMTIGHYTMSIQEFLVLIEEIVTTNSLRIESREKYLKLIRD